MGLCFGTGTRAACQGPVCAFLFVLIKKTAWAGFRDNLSRLIRLGLGPSISNFSREQSMFTVYSDFGCESDAVSYAPFCRREELRRSWSFP